MKETKRFLLFIGLCTIGFGNVLGREINEKVADLDAARECLVEHFNTSLHNIGVEGNKNATDAIKGISDRVRSLSRVLEGPEGQARFTIFANSLVKCMEGAGVDSLEFHEAIAKEAKRFEELLEDGDPSLAPFAVYGKSFYNGESRI